MGVNHRRLIALLLPALLLLAAGCRHDNELLESELRARERDVDGLKDEVHRLEWHNEALQRQLGAAAHPGPAHYPPESAAQAFELRRITLGRGTGGYDVDHRLGDDALQVVLEPRDGEDHVVKAPGTLTVTALDISPEGVKTPFSSWTVGPEQLRKNWRNGIFSTGYVLVLPWQAPPHGERIRVVARLQTVDGRLFETDRDVRIVLPPEPWHPKGPPAPGPAPKPLVPPEPLPLPTPRPAETGDGPGLEPAAHWGPPPLEGAVQLLRPTPLDP
jgi:hypothetical protein